MKKYDKVVNMVDTCVAFGEFESMHKGHLAVVKTVADVAKDKGLNSVIVSMPVEGKVFTTEEEKEYLVKDYEIDTFVTCTECKEDFIENTIFGTLGAKVVVIGETSSKLAEVRAAAEKANAEVVVVEAVKNEEKVITLDAVKEAFEACDYIKMKELLGHPYIMMGEVVHGKALGRTQGMPTANLGVPDCKIKPIDAVYCTRVLLDDESFKAMTNIGKRPSVDDFDYVTIEAFILDFKRDIYGKKLVLEVHKYVRGVKKFNDLAEVKAQIDKDIQEVRDFLDHIS